ncbi:MAG: hypothetical protein ACLFTJ_14180, partial [Halothece sp.]
MFAFILLNEPLSNRDILGMLFLLSGTYVLQIRKNNSLLEPFLFAKKNNAYLYIIGAILLFTSTSILDKALLSNYMLQPEAFLPVQQFLYTLIFLIIFLITNKKKSVVKEHIHHSWKWILLIAVLAV